MTASVFVIRSKAAEFEACDIASDPIDIVDNVLKPQRFAVSRHAGEPNSYRRARPSAFKFAWFRFRRSMTVCRSIR